MQFEDIVRKFIDNSCYLTNGAGLLSTKWNVSKETVKNAKKEARKRLENIADYGTEYAPKDVAFGKNTSIVEGISADELKEISKPEGKLVKKWFNGKTWCESRSYEGADGINIDDILKNFDFNIVPTYLEKITPKNGYILSIYLSDQHIGAKVENGLYTNYFDADIYSNRMNKVLKSIIEKSVEFGGFEQINIFYLGDTFDGQDGFTVKRTHNLPQNMSNNEAFELGLDVNLKFITNVVENKVTNNIKVFCVQDSNHGGSMDFYLFKALQKVLKYKYPEIEFTIADKFIDYMTVGIHTFLYTHGKDGKDMKHGLPLDLNDKTEVFINQYIDNFRLSGNISVIKGDLHQDALSTGKKFRYRNVPSLFGSSGWIMKNYGNTKPGVGYDIFKKDSPDIMGGVIQFL